MSTEVAELFVTLRGINTDFVKSMDEAAAAAGRTDSRIAGLAKGVGTVAIGFAAAAIGVGVEAVKMAATFDSSMTRISTLAGVPKAQINSLGSQVLALAGQVGFSPESLAEALYHVESSFQSTGITGKTAMDILKVAAQGAAIGHADLVDVTNALDAAIASGIPGVQNYSQAMGALLKIVGSGDMQMQDLADAFGTGILAIAKQYGATLTDVGAALATFGDNNIRGQVAATDLRMAIMDLTKQSAPGQAALEKIGIASGQLGKDMQTGGLNKAIIDLHKHLDAAGIKGTAVGRVLEDAFTKKSSAPLAILLGEFDRLESKYPDIAKGATNFGDAWKQTTGTISQQWNGFKATLEAAMIGLGHELMPIVGKIFSAFTSAFQWLETHKSAMQAFGNVVKTFVAGALIVAAGALATMALEFAPVILAFTALSLAIGALTRWLIGLYEHNAKFRAFVDRIVADVQRFGRTIITEAGRAYDWFRNATKAVLADAEKWWSQHGDQVKKDWDTIRTNVSNGVDNIKKTVSQMFTTLETWWAKHKDNVSKIVDQVGGFIETVFVKAVPVVVALFEFMAASIKLAFDNVMGTVAILVDAMTGHWSQAWHDMTTTFGQNGKDMQGVADATKKVIDAFGGKMDDATKSALGLANTGLPSLNQPLSTVGQNVHAMQSKVDGLNTSFSKTPPFVSTKVSAPNIDDVTKKANGLYAILQDLTAYHAVIGITADVSGALNSLDTLQQKMFSLGSGSHGPSLSSIFKNITPVGALGGMLGGNASGGTEKDGWHWVGENGPELRYTDSAGRSVIYPAAQSKQMAAAGVGGGTGHQVVQNFYGVAADPHELGRIAASEMGWELRLHA